MRFSLYRTTRDFTCQFMPQRLQAGLQAQRPAAVVFRFTENHLRNAIFLLALIAFHCVSFPQAQGNLLEGAHEIPGFLTLLQKEDQWFLKLKREDLDRDLLMSASMASGLGYGGIFPGTMFPIQVIRFRKIANQIQMVYRDVFFTAGSDKNIEKMVESSFQDSIFCTQKILQEKDGEFFLDATTFFASDFYFLASRIPYQKKSKFNPQLSRISQIKNFEKNTEVRSILAFSQGDSPLHVDLFVHYSFFPFPEPGFKPRKADDKIGHFLVALKDFSIRDKKDNYIRFIKRWRLEKADPSQEKSVPVKPIIFWLLDSIPRKYLKYVREGVLEWNLAFEKIGYVGAIEARIETEQDSLDPQSNQIHSIGWITTDKPSYGAIGPSRANPLTGEILDADILLDDSKIRSKISEYKRLHDKISAGNELEAKEPIDDENGACMAMDLLSDHLALFLLTQAKKTVSVSSQTPVSSQAATTPDTDTKNHNEKEMEEFIGQALKWVVMHEVGHTLGLRHNFKGSLLHPLEDLHNKEITARKGLYGSVMEYPGINLASDPKKQGYWFTPTLGPYDYWAIEYAYRDFPSEKEESAGLEKILKRAGEHELAYGTDEDAKGVFGSNCDPYCALYDLGQEPLKWHRHMMNEIGRMWNKISDRVPFHELESAWVSLLNAYMRSLTLVSRFPGGKEFNRIIPDSHKRPITPISLEVQKEAFEILREFAFSDTHLKSPKELLESIPSSRWWHRGSDIYAMPVDKNQYRVLSHVQKIPFQWLFQPRVFARILDTQNLYENDKKVLDLDQFFTFFLESVFTEIYALDGKKPQTMIPSSRRELQRYFVKKIMELTEQDPEITQLPYEVKTMSRHILKRILYRIERYKKEIPWHQADPMTKIHIDDLYSRTRSFLEDRNLKNY